ncbi:MAG: DNA polymerase III subunit alpha [Bacteroidales bacterium]|nr:DNA polymerase III subunit alpha [Bacteroidales bacterium]
MYYNNHTYYSLRYGTLSPEALVKLAKANGLDMLGIADINNSTGVMDFVKICNEEGIHPVAGIEFREGNRYLYTGIARNNEGFRELNEFLSEHRLNKTPLPKCPPQLPNVYVVYPFEGLQAAKLQDNEYIGIRPSDSGRLLSSPFRSRQSKLIVRNPVTFTGSSGYELHRHLRAIDNNTLLSKLDPSLMARPDEMMLPADELLKAFEHYPDIIRNTEKMMAGCHIEFDFHSIKNKKTFTGSLYDDKILLEKLAMDGLEYRYGKKSEEAGKRVKHELDLITRLGFASYFLITWDIIRYSMSRGFYHVGRGSGANSVVAYCLRITDVDPIELNLYFERFINPRRSTPPDFDIDYSWRERGDVQDYIFKRYGRKHTALLGAMSTFRGRSIFRELGKVYGLPKAEIDRLVHYPDDPQGKNQITDKIHALSGMMAGFPNLRSIHAGGILISEEPIYAYTALDMPPKGFPTTQWDMYVAEDIGFEKLDILSQRGIGHIRECADIVAENRGIKVDVHQVDKFKKDQKVKDLLRKGETNGCFYVESPAMRGLLKKLRCDDYLRLVAASSIIRPGVARSGMMREYIHRFHHPDGFEYIHPVMKEQLEETYGVMVYQEDVLKVCHHFAGLDLADSDVLRRAMSGKFRGRKEFDRIVKKFFSNCKEYGYPEGITKEVWRQIESFAGYSFSKAHSASYAVESFQSLYLKAHYPMEFMVAVINNFGGFFHRWVYFNEARRWGAEIMLPCVNHSNYNTRIIGTKIYTGFIHIGSLQKNAGHGIAEERERNGEFRSLEDFISRMHAGIEQMVLLIRTGAFNFTGKPKSHLLWEAHLHLGKNSIRPSGPTFFRQKAKKFSLPQLESSKIEDAYDEIELIGFPQTLGWFDLLQNPVNGTVRATDMTKYVGRKVQMAGLLVTVKYVRTVKKQIMHFAAFLDDKGEFFDSTHFPDTLKRYPFRGNGVYMIYGKIVEEFGFPSLEVERMLKLPLQADPRSA